MKTGLRVGKKEDKEHTFHHRPYLCSVCLGCSPAGTFHLPPAWDHSNSLEADPERTIRELKAYQYSTLQTFLFHCQKADNDLIIVCGP